MAKSNKKPLSLNDRHYRLLQDLSAPSKSSCRPSDEDNDIPHFSRMGQSSGITDFDSPLEKKKPTKVKIEGRRRLCKVSARDNDTADNTVVLDEPSFSDITDFDSPPPKNADEGAGENRGGNEIQDILNNLSAKFDFLSIEKKTVSKRIDLVNDSLALTSEKEMNEGKNADFPEYASAGSSFSLASDISSSSSDDVNLAGGGVEKAVEENWRRDIPNVSEGNGVLCIKNNSGRLNRDEPGELGEKSLSGRESFVIGERKDDDEDDCIVLSGKKTVKVVQDSYSDSEVDDVLNDRADDSVLDSNISFSGPTSTYKMPSKIAKMLYPHQRDGLRWLWSLHCRGKGGILGDDMGLGKTMQICGFLAGLFHSHLIRRALVVAPKTLMPHWIKELSTVGLSGKIREYFGTCPKARQYELQYILQDKGVLLTTYDIVRNNSKSLRGDYYFNDEGSEDSVIWDYMILDEGHLVKNPSTQRAKSLLEIPSAHRIIISGTPLQNNLKELWALFNFCCPELLGDKQWFKEKYEYPILRGNEKKASDRDRRIGSAAAKELRERIEPYFLRRLKSEVFREDNAESTAKLSKKSELIVWLRLTSCQRQLYEAFLKTELVLSAFDGSPLAALTILKKICDHPLLLTKRAAEDVLEGMESSLEPEDVNMAEKLAMHIADVAETDDLEENRDHVSCKLSFILSLLDNLMSEGHSVLIFSQTRKMLNLIQDSIISKGYKFLRIDGTTKASDRVKIVNDFQEGEGALIFLLTSQVGGLGLTLTRADRVIVVDPAWNPSTDSQSVDRAYRIGQKKDVIVYRLMTCGTVEEKIYRKQIFKGGLFRTATEHREQMRYFSQQDLCELFSLPEQGFDVSVTQQQLHAEHDCQHIMDSYLKAHVEFLETKGIAGVSHHSLLYSKTAPVEEAVNVEEEVIRRKGTAVIRYSSSSSSVEHNVDGAVHAFKPKDVNLKKKSSSPDSAYEMTELELKERINRLSHTLANKAMVAKLPDKGAKLEKQIIELKSELYKIKKKRIETPVIDLDDLTGDLQRVLNV